MATCAALVARNPEAGITGVEPVVTERAPTALTLHSRMALPSGGAVAGEPELVIVENFGPRACRAALKRRMRLQMRLLLCVTKAPTHPEWLIRFLLRSADAVVADGDEAVRTTLRLSGAGPRVFALLNSDRAGLAPFLQCPASRTARNAHRLVFADDLAPHSGAADFLVSAMGWAERNPHRALDICWLGDGILRDVLKAQPVPPNLSQRFSDRFSTPQSADVFAESGILVAPTAFGNARHPVLHGLAAALPVLGSTRCQWVRPLVRHAITGWVFDPLAPGAMFDALTQALATSPETLNQMRRTARSEVEAASVLTMRERVRHAAETLLGSSEPGRLLEWRTA